MKRFLVASFEFLPIRCIIRIKDLEKERERERDLVIARKFNEPGLEFESRLILEGNDL